MVSLEQEKAFLKIQKNFLYKKIGLKLLYFAISMVVTLYPRTAKRTPRADFPFLYQYPGKFIRIFCIRSSYLRSRPMLIVYLLG